MGALPISRGTPCEAALVLAAPCLGQRCPSTEESGGEVLKAARAPAGWLEPGARAAHWQPSAFLSHFGTCALAAVSARIPRPGRGMAGFRKALSACDQERLGRAPSLRFTLR